MVKVKICGITNREDACLASALGADVLGFIFTKKSPRCLKRQSAEKIIKDLGPFVLKAGIFADDKEETVLEIARKLKLDILQFHGKESPAYCGAFTGEFRVVKTVFFSHSSLSGVCQKYPVDAFLADIPYEEKQKGRVTLSEGNLKELSGLIKEGFKVIVSGGLSHRNVSKAVRINPYAIDVASGIEKMIGKKDEEKMRLFIKKAKFSL
jgi:phosphoribosylanthranilate isomerase